MKQFSAIAQTFILTSFSILYLLATPAQAASFRSLGFLDSNNQSSSATGVSADGSVVVGSNSNSNGYSEAFRWTQVGGMVSLGYVAGGFSSYANAVSADGSVIVGSNISGSVALFSIQAFRWTQEDGMVGLGDLFGGGFFSHATSVSADGSIIVGKSYGSDNIVEAFRWTQTDGMLSLGFVFGNWMNNREFSVSADGSVIVGSNVSVNGYEAFRWTQSGGMVGLGDLPGGNSYSAANAVSADGSIVVGSSDSVNGTEAFRWTELGGMVGLGDLPGGNFHSVASAVSADGSVVVGSSNIGSSVNSGNQYEAFRWTQAEGMVSLKDTLIGAGLDLSGWNLDSANAISADGFTIVGDGTNPSGQREAWVANLSPEPVPEPLTILGSMAAIAFAAGFERKFSKNKSDEKDPDA